MQTLWDAKPFLGCCEELLGAEVNYQDATDLAPDGRLVQVKVFPAATDPEKERKALRSRQVADARQRLAPCFAVQVDTHLQHGQLAVAAQESD